MALTRITKGVIKPNENYDIRNIVSTGIITAVGLDINGNADISGNFSVGGVLTYEDVTSIDSVGIITARSGVITPYVDVDDFLDVGSNIKLGNAGVITATSFVGNGAGLTGVVAVPTGAIMAWPVESAPTGFILCHGQAISRSTYSDLYGLIGVMYGAGDGSANFNLPDYRGQFLRGRANGSTNDPDRASRTDRGDGNGGDNVGTKQDYSLLQHTHGNNSGGNSHYGYNSNNNNTSQFSKSGHGYPSTQSTSGSIVTSSWGTNQANVNGHVTNNENRPINIYVNWIIKS